MIHYDSLHALYVCTGPVPMPCLQLTLLLITLLCSMLCKLGKIIGLTNVRISTYISFSLLIILVTNSICYPLLSIHLLYILSIYLAYCLLSQAILVLGNRVLTVEHTDSNP